MATKKKTWSKDEVKLIVAETIEELKSIKEDAEDYPDFEKWKDNLIELDCGLKFAPEDFYVDKKKFFTWDEAMEYEEKILKPNGFRLPTLVDWTMAFCGCGQKDNGEDNPDSIEKILALSKNGLVSSGLMSKYNKDPDSVSEDDQGAGGYFWSSTAYSGTNAYGLGYYSTGINPRSSRNKGNGFSVRCVLR